MEMRMDMSFRKSRAYLFSSHEQKSWVNDYWATCIGDKKARSMCFFESQQDPNYIAVFGSWF